MRCQIGNFESLHFTEGVSIETTEADYAKDLDWVNATLKERIENTGRSVFAEIDLSTVGKSQAGQLAISLKG